MLKISLLLIKKFFKFDYDKMYIIFKICFLEFWKKLIFLNCHFQSKNTIIIILKFKKNDYLYCLERKRFDGTLSWPILLKY